MKKIIILLFLTLILTGCNVNYNVNYNESVFEEEIVIKNYLNSDALTFLPDIPSLEQNGYFADVFDTVKFEQTIKPQKNNYYDITLSYKYNVISYKNSKFLNTCFEFHDFEETNEYYYISAYGTFYCENEDKTYVNIISDKAILFHNASKVSGYKYTWNLSKMNFSEEGIKVQISKSITAKPVKSKLPGLIIQISLLGGFAYLYYWMKQNPVKVKQFSDRIGEKVKAIKNRNQNKF